MPLLIMTSTPLGAAALIGTVWFIATWSPYFDTIKHEHKPYRRSEIDDEEWEL